MPELFTIRFTTKVLSKKYDGKGKLIGQTELANPICMTALPHSTAMSYKNCDNFQIERYEMDQPRYGKSSAKSSGTHAWGGAATKKVDWNTKRDHGASTKKSVAKAPVSKVQQAAKSGDMAGAING